MNPALRRFFRQAWLRELLLAALLLQAFVPPGFMPGLDAHGHVTLKLCAFYGSSPQPPAADTASGHGTTSGDGEADHSERGPCAFAAAVQAALPTVSVTVGLPQIAATPLPDQRVVRHYISIAPHSRLARGPPAQV
jgi:hypothetical protein